MAQGTPVHKSAGESQTLLSVSICASSGGASGNVCSSSAAQVISDLPSLLAVFLIGDNHIAGGIAIQGQPSPLLSP